MVTARRLWAAAAAGMVAVGAGCREQPRAPVLTAEAVYRNDAAGLTFVAPDGWGVVAKAAVPLDRPLDRPLRRLIAYRGRGAGTAAELDLYVADLPAGADVPAYLAANPIGKDKWAPAGPPEPREVNGAAATRYALTGADGRSDARREVTAFPRGDRTYLFVTTYRAADTAARDQARRAVDTASWK